MNRGAKLLWLAAAVASLLAVLCFIEDAHAADVRLEVPSVPYIGTQWGSKLGLETGAAEPLYGLFDSGSNEVLRLSANLAFPTDKSQLGNVAAGLSLGKPLGAGDPVEVHVGINSIIVGGVPFKGIEGFFGLQSKEVVSWFVGLFSRSDTPAQ